MKTPTRPVHLAALASIITAGLLFRIWHAPWDVPVILDAVLYFWHAGDVAILGGLPPSLDVSFIPANNGWPIFLAGVFALVDSTSHIDYMAAQRATGMILSVLTALPIYVICRRFFPAGVSLIAPAIFVLEPRIAENSYLGLTEPLFILLTTSTLACFLHADRRVVWAAFPLAALAAMVRGEGVILIVPYVILYCTRFRRRSLYEAPALVLVFLLVLAPMISYRIDVSGTDAMFMRVADGLGSLYGWVAQPAAPPAGMPAGPATDPPDDPPGTGPPSLGSRAASAALASIPVIIFLAPYGLYRAARSGLPGISLITVMAFMAAGAAVAFISSPGGSRYLFPIVPILCVFAAYTVQRLGGMVRRKEAATAAIAVLIAASSVPILEGARFDADHAKEALHVAGVVAGTAASVNHYHLESGYIPAAVMSGHEFPVLSSEVHTGGSLAGCARVEPSDCPHIVIPSGDLLGFLAGDGSGLTHLVVDDRTERRPQFMMDIYGDESAYPYLAKVYDSRDDGLAYHAKIFEIDRGMLPAP